MPHRVGGLNPPDNFVALMSNGASGDINNIDFDSKRPPRASFEQVRVVATKTAAWRAVKDIETYHDNPITAMRQREVELRYRVPTDTEVARARRIPLPAKERAGFTASWFPRHTRCDSPNRRPRMEKVIIKLSASATAIVSMPSKCWWRLVWKSKQEPVSAYVSHRTGQRRHGYLPPPNQHELGGYETWLGTSRFLPNASTLLTRNLLEMLKELK